MRYLSCHSIVSYHLCTFTKSRQCYSNLDHRGPSSWSRLLARTSRNLSLHQAYRNLLLFHCLLSSIMILVPANQQGAVNWDNVADKSFNFTLGVLSRLASYGVDAYTLVVGEIIAREHPMSTRAQRELHRALDVLPLHKGHGGSRLVRLRHRIPAKNSRQGRSGLQLDGFMRRFM